MCKEGANIKGTKSGMVCLWEDQSEEGGASVSGQGVVTTGVRRLTDAMVGTYESGWLDGVFGKNGTTAWGGAGVFQGDSPFPDDGDRVTPTCVSFVDPQGTVGAKVLFNLAYGLPTLAFLVFLTMRLKPALRRLQRSQSQIMRTWVSPSFLRVCANCLKSLDATTEDQGDGDPSTLTRTTIALSLLPSALQVLLVFVGRLRP